MCLKIQKNILGCSVDILREFRLIGNFDEKNTPIRQQGGFDLLVGF
mgnify:CR=1 FL=1